MNFKNTRALATALAVAVSLACTAGQSQATILTFNLVWDGSSFGNTASAIGTISLDDTLLANPEDGGGGGPMVPTVTALEITVSGASIGNGTFTLSDFDPEFWIWDTAGATLDLSSELVGQPTSGGTWGSDISSPDTGDFNIFADGISAAPSGVGPFAPSGVGAFVLKTNAELGDEMRLTSFAPVPEPSSLALLGLGGLVFARRRRRG